MILSRIAYISDRTLLIGQKIAQNLSTELTPLISLCFDRAIKDAAPVRPPAKKSFLAASVASFEATSSIPADQVPLVVAALGCFPFIFPKAQLKEGDHQQADAAAKRTSISSSSSSVQPLESLGLALRITSLVLSTERSKRNTHNLFS